MPRGRPRSMRLLPGPRATPTAVLVTLVLVLAGCGDAAGSSTAAVSSPLLREGGWELVEGSYDDRPVPMPAGARATLAADGEQLGGTAFCNSYGAEYELDGDRVRIAVTAVTEMACEPAVMEAERVYLSALGAVHGPVELDGEGNLVLTGEQAELRFRPLPEVEERELVGTRWVLESVVSGDVAASPAGEPAHLELLADGTLRGSTGCRELSGTWEVAGDEVVFPDFSAEGPECPPELRDQDDHVVTVLGDGFQVSVEGDTLTARDPSGDALVYASTTA